MIGIIGALAEEVELLVQKIENRKQTELGELTFYTGKAYGKDVTVVKCGIGKVNAAIAASVLCTMFRADEIINTGVSGGTVGRGETVVSSRLVEHDFFGADLPQGQLEGFDSPYLPADNRIINRLVASASKCGVRVHVGTVASGDKFVSDSQTVKDLQALFDIKAVDMESAAIAQVCATFRVPFCALRTLTDNADETAVGDFYELVHAASERSCAILEEYLK